MLTVIDFVLGRFIYLLLLILLAWIVLWFVLRIHAIIEYFNNKKGRIMILTNVINFPEQCLLIAEDTETSERVAVFGVCNSITRFEGPMIGLSKCDNKIVHKVYMAPNAYYLEDEMSEILSKCLTRDFTVHTNTTYLRTIGNKIRRQYYASKV